MIFLNKINKFFSNQICKNQEKFNLNIYFNINKKIQYKLIIKIQYKFNLKIQYKNLI